MNAPSSCFCSGVNESARAGRAEDIAPPARATARPRAAISLMPDSKLRTRAESVVWFDSALIGARLRPCVSSPRSLPDFRDRVFPRQRTEPGHLGVELQFDR